MLDQRTPDINPFSTSGGYICPAKLCSPHYRPEVACLDQPNITEHPPLALIWDDIILIEDLILWILIQTCLGTSVKTFVDNFDWKWLKISKSPITYTKTALYGHRYKGFDRTFKGMFGFWFQWQVWTFNAFSVPPNFIECDTGSGLVPVKKAGLLLHTTAGSSNASLINRIRGLCNDNGQNG